MGLASAYLSFSASVSLLVIFATRCFMVASISASASGAMVAFLGGGGSKEVTLSPMGRRLARRSTICLFSLSPLFQVDML